MKKRLLSLILCFALMLSLLSCIGPVIPVRAATANQNNIVDRADYLYNITWLCQKTVYGWCGNYVFNAGTAYRLPYGQPINAGAYIGYGVSVDSFISAAKDASSVFYSSRSTYGTTNSVYYATDCSAFVSWCWGIDRKTTYSIPLTSGVTYIGMATAANTAQLQLGDCLNSNDVGHVVLVTDLAYNSSGNLTQIEITEQTPPQLKRSYYTPSELGSKYGGYYGIYRYSGTVPAAPNAYFDQCTFYPAHCQVKTAKTTSVNTLPCAKNTNGSVQVLSAEADQTFTAIGMYRNTSENLWYQVVLDGGEIAYLYSGHCTFVQELQTDLSLKDSTVPGNLKDGESFGVKGTLEAAYHQLQEVKITVYSEGSPVAGISAKNLSEAVYVAAAYKDADGNVWTSGVLGYSIGSYCTGQAAKGTEIAALAMATTVYGYHAKQYFG